MSQSQSLSLSVIVLVFYAAKHWGTELQTTFYQAHTPTLRLLLITAAPRAQLSGRHREKTLGYRSLLVAFRSMMSRTLRPDASWDMLFWENPSRA